MAKTSPPMIEFSRSSQLSRTGSQRSIGLGALMTSGARTLSIEYEHKLIRVALGSEDGLKDIEAFFTGDDTSLVYISGLEYQETATGPTLNASLRGADGKILETLDTLKIKLIKKPRQVKKKA